MGWSIGYDSNWQRDIGYGVPAVCDHPRCDAEIDRGLSFVCGSGPFGGDHGCGLFFCSAHRRLHTFRDGCMKDVCPRCDRGKPPYKAKPDIRRWVRWKLRHASWKQWRDENPSEVTRLRASLSQTVSLNEGK